MTKLPHIANNTYSELEIAEEKRRPAVDFHLLPTISIVQMNPTLNTAKAPKPAILQL